MAHSRRERDRIHALDISNAIAHSRSDQSQGVDWERFIKTGTIDVRIQAPFEIPAGSAAERELNRLEAYWEANPKMRGKYVMPGDN